MRRQLAALCAVAMVVVVGLGRTVSVHSQEDPASRALAYLAGQQLPSGAIPSGFPSYSPTEEYVIASAAAGFDPATLHLTGGTTAIDYLRANAADASSSAGRAGELLEALSAAGVTANAFGGVNIIATINGDYNSLTGAYGDGQAFTQTLAILGLRSAGQGVPQAAIDHLAAAQDSDGGWNYLASKDDASGSDTNSTAMALMALAATGNHLHDAAAVAWLKTQQQSDGGFPYQEAPTDPDSTALVIEGVLATGGDPSANQWAAGSNTAPAALRALQDPSGGYAGYSGVDAFTTSQVPLALLSRYAPAVGTYATGFSMSGERSATLRALQYLNAQQSAFDGSIPAGFPSYAPTESFVVASAVAGYDPSTISRGGPTLLQYLSAHANDASQTAGAAGQLIEAVVAAGDDPTHFGGGDLVAKLATFYNAGTGAYGDGQTFTQALALLGLESADAAVPPAAITYLASVQNTDGGWNYLAHKDDAAGSDTNSTAMAILALDGAGRTAVNAAALTWLHTQQQADGGFPYQGSPTDPDSGALVMQALIATGQDPASPQWTVTGQTVLTSLIGLQDAGGGYAGYSGVDAFTTSQVPQALERVPSPVPFQTVHYFTPGTGLPGNAQPSPTPAPTGGVIVTPSPVPTVHSPTPTSVSATPAASPTAGGIPSATAVPTTTPSTTPQPTPVGGVLGIAAPTAAGAAEAHPGGASPIWFAIAGLAAMAAVVGTGTVVARRRH